MPPLKCQSSNTWMSESPHMPHGVTCTEIFHNRIMPAPSSNPIDQLLFLVFAFCRCQLMAITAKYQKDNLIETEYKRGVYKIQSNEVGSDILGLCLG